MGNQLDIFIHNHENNRESEEHYVLNMEKFSKQAKFVLELLMKGEVLTTLGALKAYNIGDLRTRISDLRKANIKVEDEFILDDTGKKTRFKKYFIKTKAHEYNTQNNSKNESH